MGSEELLEIQVGEEFQLGKYEERGKGGCSRSSFHLVLQCILLISDLTGNGSPGRDRSGRGEGVGQPRKKDTGKDSRVGERGRVMMRMPGTP